MTKGLLFRLDDIAPGLKNDNLNRLEEIFDRYDIKPILGVVPCLEDEHLVVDEVREDFWEHIKALQDKGWPIALHGYKHVYVNECSGLLEANPFSEFAGVDLDVQLEMIAKGKEILEGHGLKVEYFMAPGHTFDENTLIALVENGITRLTDGYSKVPYVRDGVTFYPCTLAEAQEPEGIDTVCIHLNNWGDENYTQLEEFLAVHKDILINFSDVDQGISPVQYNRAIEKQENDFKKLRDRKNKAANSERMQHYLRKSYSKNKYVKLIKRVLMLPLLVPELVKAILFLFILFFIIRSLSYVLRTNGDSKDRFAGFYAEEKNSIDVMMFGSSTVGASFCAPYMWGQYGFTAYPLSSNSQSPVTFKYLIEESMRRQKPAVVVIEMRTFAGDLDELSQDEGHVREAVDNMKYSLQRIKTINGVATKFEDKWPFYLDIMKYHSNIGMLLNPHELKKFAYHIEDPNKGFVFRDEGEFYRQVSRPELDKEGRKALQPEQEEVLIDLMDYLKDNDIKAVFVVVPRENENDYQETMNYAGDVVRAHGFDFLDMNYYYEEMGFDYQTDWYDGAHTNVLGAVKCSDLLGKYLVDNYSIYFDHSDKTKAEWDEAYNRFMEQYNNLEMKERTFDD